MIITIAISVIFGKNYEHLQHFSLHVNHAILHYSPAKYCTFLWYSCTVANHRTQIMSVSGACQKLSRCELFSHALLPQGVTYQITSCHALVSVCVCGGPPLRWHQIWILLIEGVNFAKGTPIVFQSEVGKNGFQRLMSPKIEQNANFEALWLPHHSRYQHQIRHR